MTDFKVDPASLRVAAGQLDVHAGAVASHGETLGASTAGSVGHGAIGEVVETATKRGLRIVFHDISNAVHKFYTDAATVMRKAATETERVEAENRTRFDSMSHGPHDVHLGARAGVVTSPSGGGQDVHLLNGTTRLDHPPASRLPHGGAPAAGARSNFTATGDTYGRYAAKAQPLAGHHDVIVHGDPTGFGATPSAWKQGTNFDHRVLANRLKHDPTYKGGPIRLMSCKTGAPSATAAQNLANKLGVNVLAPSDTVWAYPSGKLSIGPTANAGTGSWVNFKPGGNRSGP
jgi:hypothetical protein